MSKIAPSTRGVPQDSWSTPYNPFNSMKYLLWRDYLEAIVDGNFKPPFMVDVDPSNLCNYNCIWCNSKGFRKKSPTMMTAAHLLRLADFLKNWGVKSACVSGGGEPLMAPGFSAFLRRMKENGLKTGIISNGSMMTNSEAKAIVECSSWCGFSVDASNSRTFSRVHNVADTVFLKVINNLTQLVRTKKRTKSNVEITFKFLLHPLNAGEIYEAACLAKTIGVDTFHLRPVCWDNLYDQKHDKSISFINYVDVVNFQMERCRGLEDDSFKFFGIRHKFGERFERKVNFKRCLATPMMTTFGADGNVHLCFDVRGRPEWILCRHDPNPEEILKVWGSEKHKKIIDGINPDKCPRCTFGTLNEIIEEVIIKDKMFKDFL